MRHLPNNARVKSCMSSKTFDPLTVINNTAFTAYSACIICFGGMRAAVMVQRAARIAPPPPFLREYLPGVAS
jgi:hypothetical protein